jgi:hypothetical protein
METLCYALKLAERPVLEPLAVRWTEYDVAAHCGVSVHLVRKWRMRGTGPQYHKLSPGRGGSVRYDPADVREYWDSLARTSTTDD